MKIIGNKILIQPTEPIDKLPSGIYLPQSVLQKPNTGIIVEVGSEAESSFKGRTVMYNPITAINIEGKHLIHSLDIKFVL